MPGEQVHAASGRIIIADEGMRNAYLRDVDQRTLKQSLRRSELMATEVLRLMQRQLPQGRVEWINLDRYRGYMQMYVEGMAAGLGPNDHDWVPLENYARRIRRPLVVHEVGLYLMGRIPHSSLAGVITCLHL